MSLKTKVILLLIFSNLLFFITYTSIASKGIEEAYSFTVMPDFEKTVTQSVELFNKSNDLSAREKAEYKTRATNLMQEYRQRSVFKEEVTNRLNNKIFWYFLPFLIIMVVLAYLFFAVFTAPINRLAKLMQKYPEIQDEELQIPKGRNETAVLYLRFAEMRAKIAEYENLLRKEEKVSGWMEMSRAIVHEMNNFLMPLENHLNSLNKKAENQPEYQSELAKVNRSFNETKRVIANMRNFYSSRKSELERVNLNDDLAFICSGYQAEFIAQENQPVEVMIDRLELNQVLVNLIKNAKESATDERAVQVKVSLQKKEGLVQIAIQDNGKGITPADLAKIFDPGFTSKKNGLGFGLALVQKIATINRWTISVESTLSSGTTFVLTIPEQV